jgi:hypothetical protein
MLKLNVAFTFTTATHGRTRARTILLESCGLLRTPFSLQLLHYHRRVPTAAAAAAAERLIAANS